MVLFVAGIALGSGVFERLDPDVGDVAGTESARAEARLDTLDPGGESIAAVADGLDPRDPAAAAELLSMPVVLVLLLVIFAGVVAAGLPVLVGVAGTLLALLGISSVTEVSVYSVNVVTMLGLGLAVDYALLLVSRFREERATRDLPAAVEAAAATAGRMVVFSGLTVAASLAGLLVFADPFLRSMAYGGGAVVLIDMLAAITLLPALLGMWGHRVRPTRAGRQTGTGLFATVSRVVRRRALLIVVAVAVPLAVAATPFLHARYQQPDAGFLPDGAESRELVEVLQARFDSAVWAEPVVVVADAGTDQAGLAAFAGRLAGLEGVRAVSESRPWSCWPPSCCCSCSPARRRPGTRPATTTRRSPSASSARGGS